MPIVSLLKGKAPVTPQAAGERLAECAVSPGDSSANTWSLCLSSWKRVCSATTKMTHNFPPVIMSVSKCVCMCVCMKY